MNNPKVLIRPEQDEGAKGKNVVIGDPKPMNTSDKILAREVIKEKTDDGKDTLKIIIRNPRLGGSRKLSIRKSICFSGTTGQTGVSNRSDRFDRSDRSLQPVRPVR